MKQLEQERKWRLAEVWIESGKLEQAARELEDLVQTGQRSQQVRSALAEVYFHAGKYDACRRLILALQAEGLDTPLGRAGLAALDLLENNGIGAAEHLRQAETMKGSSARILEIMGRLYLGLRRRNDAARVLDAALEREPQFAAAHETRAMAYLLSGDPISAERHAREAIGLRPHSASAHCRLGTALIRQRRWDEATDALKAAASLDVDGSADAHRHLVDVYQRRGEQALAMHHRWFADRRKKPTRQSRFDFGWFNEEWNE